jgi:hypothetical protein
MLHVAELILYLVVLDFYHYNSWTEITECCDTQIEALKEVGVTEVVLAINYQPEVTALSLSACMSAHDEPLFICRTLRSD